MRLHCSLLQIWFGSSRDSLQGDGLSGLFLLHKFSFAWNFSLLSPTICLPGNLIIWNSPILNLIKIKSEELDIQFEFRTWVKLNQSAVPRDCPVFIRSIRLDHNYKLIVIVLILIKQYYELYTFGKLIQIVSCELPSLPRPWCSCVLV